MISQDSKALPLLQCLASGQWVSGTQLAQHLGVSREAVSQRVRKLAELGLAVDKQAGRGYRLSPALDLLDATALAQALQPQLPAGELAVLLSTVSTNHWLGEQQKVRLCFAEHQSGGRGRRGRDWHSPFGQNIYLSLKVDLPSWPDKLPALGLALGVALCQNLQHQLTVPMQLKWPNDLYLNGRKCGGMLIEQRGEAQGHCQLIIGLGLNVCMSQAHIEQQWTSLHKEGYHCGRNQVAEVLAQTLLCESSQLNNAHLSRRLAQFQQHDIYHQCAVSIITPHQRHQGQNLGIDEWGRLKLQTDNGLQHFSVGDVSLRAQS